MHQNRIAVANCDHRLGQEVLETMDDEMIKGTSLPAKAGQEDLRQQGVYFLFPPTSALTLFLILLKVVQVFPPRRDRKTCGDRGIF